MEQEIRMQKNVLLLSWLLAIILILLSLDLFLFMGFDTLAEGYLIYACILLLLLSGVIAFFGFTLKYNTIRIHGKGMTFHRSFRSEEVCWEEFWNLEIKVFVSRSTLVKVVLYYGNEKIKLYQNERLLAAMETYCTNDKIRSALQENRGRIS